MIYKVLDYDLDSDISNQIIVGTIFRTLFFNKRICYHHPFIDIMGIILGYFSVILITYIISIINKKNT